MIYSMYANRVYANVTLIRVHTYTPGTHVRLDVHRLGGIARDVTRDFSSNLDRVSTISRILRGRARDRNEPGQRGMKIYFRRALSLSLSVR